jgi:opacity protein-like surface antigen
MGLPHWRQFFNTARRTWHGWSEAKAKRSLPQNEAADKRLKSPSLEIPPTGIRPIGSAAFCADLTFALRSFYIVRGNVSFNPGWFPENKLITTMKIRNYDQSTRQICAVLVTVTTLLFSGASARGATLWDGVYLDVFGGFSGLSSGDVKQSGQTSDGSYDGGFLSGLAVGKKLSPAWSLELEWFYRNNGVDSINGGVFDGVSDGDFASTNLMFNVIYTFRRDDANEGFFNKISPYVGLGLGAMQEVDIDMKVAGIEQEFSDHWVPSSQIILGAIYPINACFSAFAELRYHYSGSPTLDAENGGGRVDADYDGYSALFGLRYSF